MRKFLSLLAVLVLLGSLAFSQTKTVTGRVVDKSGQPVPFATIRVKGTKVGVSADANGYFTIKANSTETLEVTATGISPISVPVGDSPEVTVTATRSSNLDEVVVTALGITRSKNQLPYSVQVVQGDQVNRQRNSNFIANLEGQVAGLQINQSNSIGGSTNVVLRGYKSVTGNNQALFVVDGVPYDNANDNDATQRAQQGGFDYGNNAADINPDDIASISVLKGAAASALYGERGFNGVILVTTKKGTSRGLGVTVNTSVTTGSIDKSTFLNYQHQYGANYGSIYQYDNGVPGGNPNFLYFDVNGDGVNDNVVPTTEDASWGQKFDPSLLIYQWDAFYPNSPYYHQARPWVAAANDPTTFFTNPFNYNLAATVQGGSDKGTYSVGYTRNDDKGLLPNSHITKDLFNMSGMYKLSDRLNVSAMVNYSNTEGKGRYGTGYDPSNPMTNFRQWFEMNVDIKEQQQAYEQTGLNTTWNWADPSNEQSGLVPIYWNNVYFDRYHNYETDSRSRVFGNLQLNYQLTSWLSVMGRVAIDHYDEQQDQRYDKGSVGVSYYSRYNKSFNETNLDLMFNVNKDISKDLNFKALLGGNIRKDLTQSISASTNGGLILPGLFALSNSVSPPLAPLESYTPVEINSAFAGATFTYRKFLVLDGTIRRDVSSTLPEGNNVYYYPSVSGSLVFSELMKGQDWLSYGKLRANYATVGHSAPAFATVDTYTLGAPFNGNATAKPSTTKNNNFLVPEQNASYEFGVEAKFLNSRLGFDVTYYHARTYNQIIPTQISNATGYAAKYVNAGTIQNQGVELTLNGVPFRSQDFEWDITVNFTKNNNTVISLNDTTKNILLQSYQGGVSLNATVGQPYGQLRGNDFVYTNGQKTVKANGWYQLSATSNNVIGNATPEWLGSIYNSFRYKNVTLGFMIDTRKGGDVFSLDTYYGMATGLYDVTAANNDLGNPVRNTIADGGGLINPGVTADGKPNTIRKDISAQFGAFGYVRNPDKAFVYDGSFWKLREVDVTYSLPASTISKIAPIKGIDISVVGRNLWIIHKNMPYSDPEEIISAGNTALGYQGGAYPTVRSFTFNLKFRF